MNRFVVGAVVLGSVFVSTRVLVHDLSAKPQPVAAAVAACPAGTLADLYGPCVPASGAHIWPDGMTARIASAHTNSGTVQVTVEYTNSGPYTLQRATSGGSWVTFTSGPVKLADAQRDGQQPPDELLPGGHATLTVSAHVPTRQTSGLAVSVSPPWGTHYQEQCTFLGVDALLNG